MYETRIGELTKKMTRIHIADSAFKNTIRELVWAELFNEPEFDSKVVEIEALDTIFNECYKSMLQPMTIKEAILKNMGPGTVCFCKQAIAFAESDAEMLSIEIDSCCGSIILAAVYRTQSEASYVTEEPIEPTIEQLWKELKEEAEVTYYG
ncbi:hypothetical protein LCGC14_0613160 [marine sediment metagenome]|uniref:Uncharacterized protein n=1 Tax=marine sediment metagenome TaxID=412755 RepID=A0A0F9RBX2_9ZZZZ